MILLASKRRFDVPLCLYVEYDRQGPSSTFDQHDGEMVQRFNGSTRALRIIKTHQDTMGFWYLMLRHCVTSILNQTGFTI